MTAPKIYAGSSFRSTASWSVDGQLKDPTTVKLVFQLKEGGPKTTWVFGTDVQIVHVSAGVFSAVIPTTEPGIATVQWSGTGAADAQLPTQVPIQELPL